MSYSPRILILLIRPLVHNEHTLFPYAAQASATQWLDLLLAHIRKSGTLPSKIPNLLSITNAHTAWDALRMIVYATHPAMGVCRILHQSYPTQAFRQSLPEFWETYLDILQLKNVFQPLCLPA